MQGGSYGGSKPVSVILMIVLTVLFALQCINDVYLKSILEDYLALTPAAVTRGWLWQLLTFQFFHNDLWHLAGNLLGLWFFGRFVENVLGRGRFVLAYLACGVVGGILQAVLMAIFPGHFGLFVFGASAGTMGLLAIFARLESESEIRWNFILPIKAGTLLIILAAVALFFTLVPSGRGGSVAHAAHLGGIIAGVCWVKFGWHGDFVVLPWESAVIALKAMFKRTPGSSSSRGSRARIAPVPAAKLSSAPPPEQMTPDFIAREIDPILDKISAHGIQSLTAREREILEAARSKMAKK